MAEVDINKPWLHNVTEAAPCQCECHSEPIGLGFPFSRKKDPQYWRNEFYKLTELHRATVDECKLSDELSADYRNLANKEAAKATALEKMVEALKKKVEALEKKVPSLKKKVPSLEEEATFNERHEELKLRR